MQGPPDISIYGENDPEDLRKNWRKYHPPLVPIYYMKFDELKKMLETNGRAVHPIGLQMMLGFFEEFEKYEEAAFIKTVMTRIGLFDQQESFVDKLEQDLNGHNYLDDTEEDDEDPFSLKNPFE